MAITARISSSYRRRLIMTAIFLSVFGLWAAYDVFVKYPPEYERSEAFLQFRADGNVEAWPEHARQAGWSEEEPKVRNKGHFYFNYAIMVLIPLGMWFGYNALTSGRRWITADEQGLSTWKGQNAPYSNIVELNEKRWEDKGIAVVMYDDAQGSRQRLVLDEFNFETQPVRDMHSKVKEILAARNGVTPEVTPEEV